MSVLVKSLNGLAYGSVKSRNGLAVAGIKSINGLDATTAGPSLIANTGKAGSDTGVTSDAINTTGANLIVVSVAWFAGGDSIVFSDSKGNTWTPLTAITGGATVVGVLYYCFNPTVGSGHTFSVAQGNIELGIYPSLCVTAWSGIASSPFDTENGIGDSSWTTINTGSIAPSPGTLVIAGLAFGSNSGGTISIDSGFTITDTIPTGTPFGCSMAYKIQSGVSLLNPQWTSSAASNQGAAVIAAFSYT